MVSRKCRIQGMTNNAWANLKKDSQQFYTTGVWDERTGGFYANVNAYSLYHDGEFKYCLWGSENPSIETCTPFMSYDGTPTVSDNTWYSVSNIHFYPCFRQPNLTRNQSILVPTVYGNRGQGVVASNELNEFLDFENYDTTEQRVLMVQDENGEDSVDDPIARIESELTEVDIDDKIFNIEIKNLPHRTYNGTTSNFDKTIYQIGSLLEGKTIEGDRIIEHYPREKIKVPLHNSGEMILNQIEVQISDEFGIQETDLKQHTNLTLEIN